MKMVLAEQRIRRDMLGRTKGMNKPLDDDAVPGSSCGLLVGDRIL
jgi:hypothetical protein